MYCSECGKPADGKFCSHCGCQLQGQPTLPPVVDWQSSIDYATIIAVAEVREEIKFAEARATKKLNGDSFLDFMDQVVQPLTGGVSTRMAAKLSKPISTALGFRTGKSHRELLKLPPGKAIASILVGLAENGHQLTRVEQESTHCRLTASIPADLCSIDGEMRILIESTADGTLISAEAIIDGQWYDWGKCQRRLNELFQSVRAAA
ncbi:hypothetical protein [Aureliella helgolandensis]|uniref:Uncharacterized protein n=1 Tax=Aureliella helgolandensis TaxID=2527968 RepID=A0A518G945_9BACT|nr:hypothetical protein [Aureliella helgolandensis]QDV25100.1 hypothetical protein Q31a_34230 [Aureliella helgolandensis]